MAFVYVPGQLTYSSSDDKKGSSKSDGGGGGSDGLSNGTNSYDGITVSTITLMEVSS